MLQPLRGISLLALVTIMICSGGCVYLSGPYGQAVSLKSYDAISIESITIAPDSPGQGWLETALRADIQDRLDASELWQMPEASKQSKIAALDIEITKAAEKISSDSVNSNYSLACNITVSDGKSGEHLGKTKLSASGSRGQNVHQTATAKLGEKIYKVLISAKRHSQKMRSCTPCK